MAMSERVKPRINRPAEAIRRKIFPSLERFLYRQPAPFNEPLRGPRPISDEFGGCYLIPVGWFPGANGKQEGVEVIVVNNGKLQFTVIPTRGMSIAEVFVEDIRLGWRSGFDSGVDCVLIC